MKRRVGYLPDNVGFYDGMTGRENLRYTARLNGTRRARLRSGSSEVLEQVGMTDRADTSVDTYSRGMLQRLGIADALVKDPAVLILDEPTTAIDPIGVVEILDLLRTLVRERGLAVLLSSHLLAQVQSVCDRVGIFAAGKLIGVGTVPELAAQFGEESARIEVGLRGRRRRTAHRGDRGAVLRGIDGRRPRSTARPAPASRSSSWPRGREDRAAVRTRSSPTAAQQGLRLSSIREVVPSLDDIYRRALHATRPRPTREARRERA